MVPPVSSLDLTSSVFMRMVLSKTARAPSTSVSESALMDFSLGLRRVLTGSMTIFYVILIYVSINIISILILL